MVLLDVKCLAWLNQIWIIGSNKLYEENWKLVTNERWKQDSEVF